MKTQNTIENYMRLIYNIKGKYARISLWRVGQLPNVNQEKKYKTILQDTYKKSRFL